MWEKGLKENAIRPFGPLDILPYYRTVAQKLKRFLQDREIATRVWIPNGPRLVKRGSKLQPLFIEDFLKGVNEELIRVRQRANPCPTSS